MDNVEIKDQDRQLMDDYHALGQFESRAILSLVAIVSAHIWLSLHSGEPHPTPQLDSSTSATMSQTHSVEP